MSSSEQFSVADCPMDTRFGLPSHIRIGTSKVSEVLTAPELKSTDEKREAINIQQQVNVAQTEAQQTSDKLNRANESDETTKINEK